MEHYTLTWAFHDAKPEDLKPGDHIYKWSSPTHAYHGIVLQQDPASEAQASEAPTDIWDRITVLRLPCSGCNSSNAPAGTGRESLRSFETRSQKTLLGGGLKVARYGVPACETWVKRYGTCYAEDCDPASEVLRRADALLNREENPLSGESSSNRQAFAKSEHLAFWCKTGIWRQQMQGVRRAAMCSLAAAVCAGMRMHPSAAIVSLAGGAVLRQIALPQQSQRQIPTQAADASEDSHEVPEYACEEALPEGANKSVAGNEEATCTGISAGASSAFQEGAGDSEFEDYVVLEEAVKK